MQEIRCPNCHRLQCKATLFGLSSIEVLCRCKTRMFATKDETLVMVIAASVSRTFDGRLYAAGMLIRQ